MNCFTCNDSGCAISAVSGKRITCPTCKGVPEIERVQANLARAKEDERIITEGGCDVPLSVTFRRIECEMMLEKLAKVRP